MPAVRQAHAQNRVAGFEHRSVNRLIGLRTRMRLHIGIGRAENLFHAVDGQLLGHVHMLAAAVIAFGRIALRVFVGQLAALRLHHRAAHIVFRGNQLDMILLALVFGGDGGGQLGVEFGNGKAFREHKISFG